MEQRRITANLLRVSALVWAIYGLAWAFTPPPAAAAPPAQGGNFLINSSFEEPYYQLTTEEGGGALANGWSAWWWNDEANEYQVPEYSIASLSIDPYRVHSGNAAQMLFRPAVRHLAGVYQRVQVPTNALLRFTIYGHAWSSFCRQERGETICDPHDSTFGSANPMHMKIGIDPTGGTDGLSPNIIWSREQTTAFDVYQLFVVDARARGNWVTVFTYSHPEFPAAVNNVYWDDAALFIPLPPTPTPRPLPAPTRTPLPPTRTPFPTPRPGGTPMLPSGGGGVSRESSIPFTGIVAATVGAALWFLAGRLEAQVRESNPRR